MNKKTRVIIYSVITLVLVAIGSYYLINTLTPKEEKLVQQKFYGEISSITDDYIELTDIENNNTIRIAKDEKLNEGDILVIYYIKGDKNIIKPLKKEILVSNEQIKENNIVIDEVDITTTTTSKITTTTTTAISYTPKSTQAVEPSVNGQIMMSENALVEMLKSDYESVKSGSISEEFKLSFIKVVDFIFYEEPIGGLKFKDLKESTKGKIIYYSLLIDSKIEKVFPEYKEKISTKYNDIKAKLYAKYLDITTTICTNEKELCTNLKSDFKLLKSSVSVTWDFLKSAIKYGTNKGISAIKSWYEVYSGK